MSTIPILGPDGQVHSIPQDQASAALQAGGKQVTAMLDPQGTKRWIPNDQLEDAQAAGGTPIRPDGSFTVTPVEGESFADTLRRGVAAGRTVSPQLIQQQTITGIKETPLALGVAATAGVAGPATLAGAGELGAAIPSALAYGRTALANPAVQQGLKMLGSKILNRAVDVGTLGAGYKILKGLGIIHGFGGE